MEGWKAKGKGPGYSERGRWNWKGQGSGQVESGGEGREEVDRRESSPSKITGCVHIALHSSRCRPRQRRPMTR